MKRPRSSMRLRTQLALFMIAGVFASFMIGYFGILAYDLIEYSAMQSRLEPAARRALQVLDAGGMPALEDFKALQEFSKVAGPAYEVRQRVALLALFTVSAIGGAIASLFLSRRLGGALEGLSEAARAVAAGDLSVRAPAARGPREIAQLITNFNGMADALERGERKLREDAAAIAHELRTPLMILQARLEALADGVFAPSREEHRRLVRQTELLGRIVEDLRTLSLARAGRLSIKLAGIDLAMVARDAAAGFEALAERAQVDLRLLAEPAMSIGDRDRLMQCVSAMIDNAIRYGGDGGEVEVATWTEGGEVVLAVRDRGPGPPSLVEAETLFEAFVRGDASRTRSAGGSGLGLAVVRAIAEAHQGRVGVAARDGGGAEFRLILPARSAASTMSR